MASRRPSGSPFQSIHILLAGSSGIPGRYILKSLLSLIDKAKQTHPQVSLKLTVLKRSGAKLLASQEPMSPNYEVAVVGDYNNIPTLSQTLQALDPDIVISALNAEPAPNADNHLVDALLLLGRTRAQIEAQNKAQTQAQSPSQSRHNSVGNNAPYTTPEQRRASSSLPSLATLSLHTNTSINTPSPAQQPRPQHPASDSPYPLPKRIFFINGFTLDILHPSVSATLPQPQLLTLQPKIQLAHRLHSLAEATTLDYATVIPASFLDYTLLKGYAGIDIPSSTATLYGPGTARLTGCSLQFVGDAVSLIVAMRVLSPTAEQRASVVNKRIRVAETIYSGVKLVETVQNVTGSTLQIQHVDLEEMKGNPGAVIRYLNWAGEGASTFIEDGLGFGASRGRTGSTSVSVSMSKLMPGDAGTDMNRRGSSGNAGAGDGDDAGLFTLERRSLEEIVRQAIVDGVQVFE